jgi:hypothetical protein
VLAACVGVELYRRQWRPAAVVAGSPWVALKIDEALKRIFQRHNGYYLT